ncbi:MAG: rhodanese-like domain-containing protein [Elusimicrobia bacterium]|nr:rhodanese-like domain-containing protein [Elusimicrobiota bacterium]
MNATLEKTHALSAVEYFNAKLQFEATPYGIKNSDKPANLFMLDVRDAESFAAEHVPGATNIPLVELTKKLKTLPKDKTIITYCWHHDCAAAPKAALELAQHGFTVKEMSGGIKAWKDAGFPVEGKK